MHVVWKKRKIFITHLQELKRRKKCCYDEISIVFFSFKRKKLDNVSMGQNSSSRLTNNFLAIIHTKYEKIFQMFYQPLVEHLLLLRNITQYPDVTKEGPTIETSMANELGLPCSSSSSASLSQ